MRVLFFYPSIDCPPGINHGLAAISGVLKADGHETHLIQVCEKLWPIPDSDSIVESVREWAPDILAFSAMSQQYAWCVELNQRLDEEFDLPSVIGGVHCTMVPDEVVADGAFDFICVGEGENAMAELLSRMGSQGDLTTTPNMRIPAARRGRVQAMMGDEVNVSTDSGSLTTIENAVGAFPTLDDLPPKDYNLFDLKHIIAVRHGWMGMLTSRGCPYKCTYCFNKEIVDRYIEDGGATKSKEYLRHYSIDRIIGEIQHLKTEHPHMETLIFDDDLFTLNRNYVHDFCQAYTNASIDLPFVVNGHVQTFDDGMAQSLSDSGCMILKFGLESGSQRVRKEVLWRFMTNDRIESAFAAAHSKDLHTSAFVMFGLPTETPDEIMETVRLCSRIKMGRFRWAIFFPFPGTAGHRMSHDLGLIDEERMADLGNYFDGSCLRFGDEQDLLIEKMGKCFHWWVNAESDWPTASAYQELVDELQGMSRAEWAVAKDSIQDRDRELSETFLAEGLPHYSIRYSHVMAVHSDFVLWERNKSLESYSLD